MGAGNINFGSFSGQIGRNLEKAICELFPKKNPPLNGYSFLIYPHFCENWPDPKKTTFSHFLQNTVLDPKRHKILKIFEKFRFWAFRKVYGLWGYFRPKKSYSHLKFQHTTVSHLCFGFSHVSNAQKVNWVDMNPFSSPECSIKCGKNEFYRLCIQ